MRRTVHRDARPRLSAPQDRRSRGGPPWLPATLLLFILLYMTFNLAAANVDLTQPVPWWERLRQGTAFAYDLPAINNPYVRIPFYALSTGLWLTVPFLLGYWLAWQTAVSFLQTFYGLSSRKSATSFMWLQLSTKWPILWRPAPNVIIITFVMLAVVPAVACALFSGIAEYLLWTQPSINESFYYFLIALLVSLTLICVLLAFLFIPQIVNRLNAVRRRVMAAGFFFLVLYVLFLTGSMALLWLMLRAGVANTRNVAGYSLILMLLLLAFYILLVRILPVRPLPVILREVDIERLRAESLVFRAGGPGRVVIPEGNYVAVTEQNGRFNRVLRPGLSKLSSYEYVYDLLDTRQYDSEGTCKATTRDGIQVEVPVGITMRIASNDELINTNPPEPVTRSTVESIFPVGDMAVRQAAYTKTVRDKDGRSVTPWYKLPIALASSQLRKVIASRNYDDLLISIEGSPTPHPELREKTFEVTQRLLLQIGTGTYLTNLRLGPILVSERVIQEHLKSWQAYWEMLAEIREAKGDAAYINTVSAERHRADRVLRQTILREVAEVLAEHDEETARKLLAHRLAEMLGRLKPHSDPLLFRIIERLLQLILPMVSWSQRVQVKLPTTTINQQPAGPGPVGGVVQESETESVVQETKLPESIDAFAFADLMDTEPDAPLSIGKSYTLRAGIHTMIPEALKDIRPEMLDISEALLNVVIVTDNMEVLPDKIQSTEFFLGEDPEEFIFTLVPQTVGEQEIFVQYYYERHWLTQIEFNVTVITLE